MDVKITDRHFVIYSNQRFIYYWYNIHMYWLHRSVPSIEVSLVIYIYKVDNYI